MAMLTLLNLASVIGFPTCHEAYVEAEATGKPMVVLVSAAWCLPCTQMKRHVFPKVDDQVWQGVAFAVLDQDRQPKLATRVIGKRRGIPQLIMYTPSPSGWKRRLLYGYHDASEVERFLLDGMPSEPSAIRAGHSSPTSR
jgi:thiol:disulfide interchange protein